LCFVDISAVALPLPPSAPVISDVTSTSCRVNYEAPDIQLDGPPVTGYFLEVRTQDGPWITVNNTVITGTEVKVTKLQCDMRYEFRVAALNDNGLGEYSTTSTNTHREQTKSTRSTCRHCQRYFSESAVVHVG